LTERALEDIPQKFNNYLGSSKLLYYIYIKKYLHHFFNEIE
jgi:hypothetical protein